MFIGNRTRLVIASAGMLLIAEVAGCGSPSSNLSAMSAVYRMSPKPLGQLGGLLLGLAAQDERRNEAKQQWATCPNCRSRAWWPRDSLRINHGRARCKCGRVFVISGY